MFLEDNELLVHLYLEVVSASLQLRFKLSHFFLLCTGELLPLAVCVLHPESLDSLCLLHLELLQFLPVVHGFLDPLIVSHQLLVVLHFLELGSWLDFGGLHSSV